MKQRAFILFIAGILYAFGFPNIIVESFLVTPIIAIFLLLFFLPQEQKLKNKIILLLSFNAGFTLSGYYWIANTLQEFGGLPYILAFLLNSLFALIITPYLWVVLLLIHKFKDFKNDTALKSFALAILFSLLEYLVPQQFDSFLGSPWIVFSKSLGFAPITGVIAYSFFSFLIVFEALRFQQSKKYSKLNLSFILLFIVLNPILKAPNNTSKAKELNIRLVQANISNYLKVDSESGSTASSAEVINRYRELSLKPYLPGKKLDLIIWPETAYPFSVFRNNEDLKKTPLPQVFIEVAHMMNTDLFVGGYDSLSESNFYKSDYNTAFHVSSDGYLINTYHKRILIPFGETLPFGPLNKVLSKYITNIAYFKEGEDYTVFEFKDELYSVASICYEILKPEFFRDYLNSLSFKPQFMINLTNDSWYGKTMEPYQHLFLSRWRAIEFQLPIVRSTNTGISSVIYPDGTESRRTGVYTTENLDLSLKLRNTETTLFQKFGIAMIFPFWIIGLIFHLLGVKLKND